MPAGIFKGRNGRADEPRHRSLPLGNWILDVGCWILGRKIMGRKIGRNVWILAGSAVTTRGYWLSIRHRLPARNPSISTGSQTFQLPASTKPPVSGTLPAERITLLGHEMKISTITIISLAAGLLLASCDIAGPAYPEKNGRTYLDTRGYSSDLISRLIDGGKLAPSEVRDFQASRSSDVRFLVARNPSLTHEQITISIDSSDDFTRSGAARNTTLSSSQIAQLTNDKSHTVYSSLAGNTALTDAELLRIREKRNLEGLWFAMNPNCPESIRESILASDDSLAKDWLKITDGWKKDGHYVQDREGRWHQSRPRKTSKES